MSRVPFTHPMFEGFDFPASQVFDEEVSRMRERMRANMERSVTESPSLFRGYFVSPVQQQSPTALQRRISTQEDDQDKFRVVLDVQHFKPEELEVKLVENKLMVHAKHEDKEDEHGSISREFTRYYVLPDDTNLDEIKSYFSKDGILTLEAPKLKSVEGQPEDPIPIPIKREDPKPVEGAAAKE
ncbi:alpha-crystallin A chain-like [Saccoglossus kowalevskii]|uniref:Alpha-crystallin A chain-like n=1 Tax=Saccoglossus kowalevskii TaxID=10224 RepID=A0ABM0MC18_SACKO|nr:PREDICTED: alpha-crystallin A chain-like [Saccoglossus kowalevskii]